MALRDFDRVRERLVLRLEIRHLVQFGLAILLLAAGCFLAGYRIGETAGLTAVPVRNSAVVQGIAARPAGVVAVQGPLPAAETPVVPMPLAPIPAPLPDHPDPVLRALTVQDREAVAATGERELVLDKPALQAPVPAEAGAPHKSDTAAVAGDAHTPKVEVPAVVAESPNAAAAPVGAPTGPVAAPTGPVAAPTGAVAAAEGPVTPWPPIGFLRSSVGAPPPKPEVTAQARPHAKPAHVAPAAPATPAPPPHAVAVTERFVVQVRAFRNESEAQAFREQLQARGYSTTLSTIDVPGKGTFYRIRLGPFPTVEQAKAAQRKFEQAEGHATMILVVGGAVAPVAPEP